MQSNVWATWSPMLAPVQKLYGWSSTSVDVLAAWGPLVYLPMSFICPSIVERIGMGLIVAAAPCSWWVLLWGASAKGALTCFHALT